MPPDKIGHFRLLDRIAAGGMGIVYRAQDERLDRAVALKLLSDSIARAPDARERFQREARAIAALNHPHICTLYDVGEFDGQPYLVMELLEGETLHARLARGAVAPAQAAAWGAEIADALQAAHAKGILHRDLKPSNILMTARGTVKVLDFGLAQIATAAASSPDAATLQAGPLTTPGTTLGTLAYMSPEQARGESTDARSDLFSLGAVLYEMVAGRPPFQGRTAADLTAAVLRETPPPPGAGKLDDVIARCLEKDPDLRYQSAADLRSDLKRLLRESGNPVSSSVVAPARGAAAGAAAAPSDSRIIAGVIGRHWRWPALAAAGLALAGLLWWRLAPRAATPAPRLSFHQLTASGQVQDAVISPDGKFLAHVDLGPKGTSLHLLSISSGSDVEIVPPAAGCCSSPSFSPDGGQVYFVENRDLYAVPVLGGTVHAIAADACSGVTFSPDGSQIAFIAPLSAGSALMLAHPDGSAARALASSPPGSGFLSDCWGSPGSPVHAPSWSPDGHWIAVERATNAGTGSVTLINADTGTLRSIGPNLGFGNADASWLPNGQALVFTASIPESATPQLWQVTFPGNLLTQLTNDLQGYAEVSVAASGELALVHSNPQFSIWDQAAPGGAFAQLPGGGASQDGAAGLAWTPQGGLISLRALDGQQQIWSENADGGSAHAILDRSPGVAPGFIVVAADGEILLASGTPAAIWHLRPDGSGLGKLFPPAPGAQAIYPVLVDGGRDVAYVYLDAHGNQNLWVVPLAGGTPRQLSKDFIFADGIAASPDGSKIFAVYKPQPIRHQPAVFDLDGGSVRITPIAMAFKEMPGPYAFTPDGRAVTYISNQGSVDNIWAVPLAGGKPYPLTHFTELSISAYAFSHDGRLAVSRGSQDSDAVVATGLTGGAH